MKAEQLDVIGALLERRDTFAILPTGFRKSLCYACLPAAFDSIGKREHGHSIVVVVTPLLAIMKDQVRQSRLGVIITDILSKANVIMVVNIISVGSHPFKQRSL